VSVYLVLSTASCPEEGEKIAQHLIQKGLAACVNVVPGLFSHFFWEGKLSREPEVLLLIKTAGPQLRKIVKEIKAIHSYSVPELLFFEARGGEKRYLAWVEKAVGKKNKKKIDNKKPKS
jgi:periplasmic divalent cation tolerance protein